MQWVGNTNVYVCNTIAREMKHIVCSYWRCWMTKLQLQYLHFLYCSVRLTRDNELWAVLKFVRRQWRPEQATVTAFVFRDRYKPRQVTVKKRPGNSVDIQTKYCRVRVHRVTVTLTCLIKALIMGQEVSSELLTDQAPVQSERLLVRAFLFLCIYH